MSAATAGRVGAAGRGYCKEELRAVVSFKSSFFVVQAYRSGIMGKPTSGKVKEYKSEDRSEFTQTLKGESHVCQPGPQKPIRLVRLGKWGMGQVGEGRVYV